MLIQSHVRVPTKNLKGVMTYLKPEVYEALKVLAETEDRSISNLVSRIVSDWVKERQSQEGQDKLSDD